MKHFRSGPQLVMLFRESFSSPAEVIARCWMRDDLVTQGHTGNQPLRDVMAITAFGELFEFSPGINDALVQSYSVWAVILFDKPTGLPRFFARGL
jgi:hypothetical protein